MVRRTYASDNAGLRVRSRLNIHINIIIHINVHIIVHIKYKIYLYHIPEIKPLYQCLIKQSLRKPTILMINFINMVSF